jgi:hypothetical protein
MLMLILSGGILMFSQIFDNNKMVGREIFYFNGGSVSWFLVYCNKIAKHIPNFHYKDFIQTETTGEKKCV